MRKPTVLVVDDEEAARYSAIRVLGEENYDIHEAENSEECLQQISDLHPDIVLLDYVMPDEDGLRTLEKIEEKEISPLVIMITARGSEKTAVEAMKKGAFDYLVKPYESEELRASVEKAVETWQLEEEKNRLSEELNQFREDRLMGESNPMEEVREQIHQVAPTDATVVITGESGTGKELAARTIHARSQREGPFRTVNCAALAKNLIESELFGHEKGAFTGADSRKRGKFELADGGTLFLDEIAEMEPSAQKKLLRVLENETIERVGGEEKIDVDVRILCATNRDLEEEIEEGNFREDLYYRINVMELEMPPLRKRPEDVRLLGNHFLSHFCDRYNFEDKHLTDDAIDVLTSYSWPGNVRELKNIMERTAIVSSDTAITPEDLPDDLSSKSSTGTGVEYGPQDDFQNTKQTVVDQFETDFIRQALEKTGGNVSQAAENIGMYRQNLQKKIKEHEIDVDEIRNQE